MGAVAAEHDNDGNLAVGRHGAGGAARILHRARHRHVQEFETRETPLALPVRTLDPAEHVTADAGAVRHHHDLFHPAGKESRKRAQYDVGPISDLHAIGAGNDAAYVPRRNRIRDNADLRRHPASFQRLPSLWPACSRNNLHNGPVVLPNVLQAAGQTAAPHQLLDIPCYDCRLPLGSGCAPAPRMWRRPQQLWRRGFVKNKASSLRRLRSRRFGETLRRNGRNIPTHKNFGEDTDETRTGRSHR